jgi:lipopolysaccharide export system protein LptA
MLNLIIIHLNRVILAFICFLAIPAQAFVVMKHDVNQRIDITSDNLEIYEEKKLVWFKGNVKTTQGEMNIFSDRMEAVFNSSLKFEFKKVKYYGGVIIKIPNCEIRGSEALLDLITKKLIISGNLIIIKGGDQIKGESLIYDLAKGLIEIKGNSKERAKVVIHVE